MNTPPPTLFVTHRGPGRNVSGPATELLEIVLQPGRELQLVGDTFNVSARLTPATAALLVSRLGYELAAHLIDAEDHHADA